MIRKNALVNLGVKLFDIRRLGIEFLVSVFIAWLIVALIGSEMERNLLIIRPFLFTVITLVGLCEGIFIFDATISRYYPWHTAVKKRVLALFSFSLVWLPFVVFMATRMARFLFEEHPGKASVNVSVAVTVLVLFSLIYLISLIGFNYHETLKRFIIDNERLQREKLELDYLSLQDQLNPHFLFNNISTLMALIPENSDKALSFAGNFADVYRYVLMSSRHKLVTLEDELTFIRSYIAMHQERLGDGLFVTYRISEDELKRKVPTLSLQFLVENAIKHNIANTKEPLFIEISAQNHLLIVKNNLTPKLSTYSTNTGLRNLKRRIQFLAPDKDLIIIDASDSFTVKVPTFE